MPCDRYLERGRREQRRASRDGCLVDDQVALVLKVVGAPAEGLMPSRAVAPGALMQEQAGVLAAHGLCRRDGVSPTCWAAAQVSVPSAVLTTGARRACARTPTPTPWGAVTSSTISFQDRPEARQTAASSTRRVPCASPDEG